MNPLESCPYIRSEDDNGLVVMEEDAGGLGMSVLVLVYTGAMTGPLLSPRYHFWPAHSRENIL